MYSNNERDFDQAAAQALKSIARNSQIKSYIQHSRDLYPLLWRAARRFVAGETRKEALAIASILMSRGYLITLECIGENTSTEVKCLEATNEFLALIEDISA